MAKHLQTGATAGGALAGTFPNPSLANTGVSAGVYTYPTVTVNSEGRITNIANGSGVTVGGSDTQVQFNSSGGLAGSDNLTFDGDLLTSHNILAKGEDATISLINVFDSDTDAGNMKVTYDSLQLSYVDTDNVLYIGKAFAAGPSIIATAHLHSVYGAGDLSNILDDGSGNMKAVGTMTATSFIGSGASLTGLPADTTKMSKASNLSDVSSVATARTNLGLGSLSTLSPTGTPSSTTYLRGDNTWATVASSGGDALVANPLSQFAATTSLQLKGVISDETGSGSLVFASSPVLVTPNLGTPSAVTLTNATGLPISTGVSGLATGVAAFLAAPTSANMAAMITDETGTGSNVFATSPTLVTPALGVATATTINKVTITAPATSATLTLVQGSTLATAGAFSTTLTATAATNVTLPITGTLATLAGVETLTNKTLTSPVLTTPNLGTPSSVTLTNGTGLVATTGLTATGTKDATTFLRGDNTWAVPAGGGSSSLAGTLNYHRATGTTLNRFYGSPSNGVALGNVTPVIDTLYAMPFLVGKSATIDTLALSVEGTGTGSAIRLGIYADNGNDYPGTLLVDAGTINSASAGLGTKTLTISQAVTPGLYWLVYVTTGTAPIVRGYPAGSLLPILGSSSTVGPTSTQGYAWSIPMTYAVLPGTAPAGGTVITAPPMPYIGARLV